MSRCWKKCDNCKVRMKRHWRYKNKILCYHCYQKKVHMITAHRPRISLDKALSKIYEIRGQLSMGRRLSATKNFPSILIGHKVKITLADEDG